MKHTPPKYISATNSPNHSTISNSNKFSSVRPWGDNTRTNGQTNHDSSDVDIFNKLIDLQSWKEVLDSQPVEIKTRIWDLLEEHHDKSSLADKISFSNAINQWAQDIVPNMDLISSLHSIVSNLMQSDLTHFPSRMERSIPSPSNRNSLSHSHNGFHSTRQSDHNILQNKPNGIFSPMEKPTSSVFSPQTLPRISILENSNNTNINGSNGFKIPPISSITNSNKNSLNVYVTNSRNLPALPPLQSSFSSNSNSPLHGVPFSPSANRDTSLKRKTHYFSDPPSKRMKMDFLNS